MYYRLVQYLFALQYPHILNKKCSLLGFSPDMTWQPASAPALLQALPGPCLAAVLDAVGVMVEVLAGQRRATTGNLTHLTHMRGTHHNRRAREL